MRWIAALRLCPPGARNDGHVELISVSLCTLVAARWAARNSPDVAAAVLLASADI
jgi:predicted alpha/beta hydrolase family esterase